MPVITMLLLLIAMNTGAAPDAHRLPATTRPAAAAAVAASTRPASRPAVDRELNIARGQRLAQITKRLGEIGHEVGKLNVELKQIRGNKDDASVVFARQDINQKIEALNAERALLLAEKKDIAQGRWKPGDPKDQVPELTPDRFGVGQWGTLRNPWAQRQEPHTFTALQVVGPEDCLYKWGDTPFWVTGQSTAGLIDNAQKSLDRTYRVIGTKRYTSASGASRTVWQLRPATSPAD